jgi:hypothetical protein
MADLIAPADAQAWTEQTKLTVSALDSNLLGQVQTQVLSAVASSYDVSTWVSPATTPAMIKKIIAMEYVSWLYNRTYSEDEDNTNSYANKLMAMAEAALSEIIAGTLDLLEVPNTSTGPGTPAFYPTDASSALEPTTDDSSLGPSSFSVGQAF